MDSLVSEWLPGRSGKSELPRQFLSACVQLSKNGIYYGPLRRIKEQVVKSAPEEYSTKTSVSQLLSTPTSDLGHTVRTLEERRAGDAPILRLLTNRFSQNEEKEDWILFAFSESPHIYGIRSIARATETTVARRNRHKEGEDEGERSFRKDRNSRVFELYLILYFLNEGVKGNLRRTLLERCTKCTSSKFVYSTDGCAKWRSLPAKKINRLPECVKGFSPEQVMDRLRGFESLGSRQASQALDELKAIPEFSLMNVPELPAHFQRRNGLLEELLNAVNDPKSTSVGVSGRNVRVGVQGMGGIGKTVIAATLARDPKIGEQYPDGVAWITVGLEPNLLRLQSQLCAMFTDKPFTAQTIEEGRVRLERALRKKRCLVVLDDMWDIDHYAAFDCISEDSKLLFTTRDQAIITSIGATMVETDLLSPYESLQLLSSWAGQSVSTLPPEADMVVKECGRLPLALAMVGAMVANEVISWSTVLDRLRTFRLEKIQRKLPNYPHSDLLKAIQVSVNALGKSRQRQYLSMAVFPEDTSIPLSTIKMLWKQQGHEPSDAEDALEELMNRALIRRDKNNRFYLHDLQHSYTRQRCPGIKGLHEKLAEAYQTATKEGTLALPNDGYAHQHFVYHLAHGGKTRQAEALLGNYGWIQHKADHSGVSEVIADFEYVKLTKHLTLIRDALKLCAHQVSLSPDSLPSQLTGFLAAIENKRIREFLERMRQYIDAPWIRPLTASLGDVEGALLSTLSHGSPVTSIAVPTGRSEIYSGSNNEIRKWDVNSGRLMKAVQARADVMALSPNGRYIARASGTSMDLRLADLDSIIHVLRPGSKMILSLAFSPDSRYLFSSSITSAITRWDVETGKKAGSLRGHKKAVTQICAGRGSRYLASCSDDKSVRVWDTDTCQAVGKPLNFDAIPLSIAFLADKNKVLVGCRGASPLVCNFMTGEVEDIVSQVPTDITRIGIASDESPILVAGPNNAVNVLSNNLAGNAQTLQGHTSSLTGLDFDHCNNNVVTASSDGTIKIWPLRTRKTSSIEPTECTCLASLRGTDLIACGRSSGAIELWTSNGEQFKNTQTELESVESIMKTKDMNDWVAFDYLGGMSEVDFQGGNVKEYRKHFTSGTHISFAESDNQLAIGTSGGRVRLLDGLWSRTDEFEAHRDKVIALRYLNQGRVLVTVSNDGFLRLWDVGTRSRIASVRAHRDWIKDLIVLVDGKMIATVSNDKTLKIWDASDLSQVSSFKLPSSPSSNLLSCSGGRKLAIGLSSGELAVVSTRKGGKVKLYRGHARMIRSIGEIAESGMMVSTSADHSLLLWDPNRKKAICEFWGNGDLKKCYVHQDDQTIVCSEAGGKLHFLRPEFPSPVDV